MTGIPRETVRDWNYGRSLRQRRDAGFPCSSDHHISQLDGNRYGYLLGIYLGDGCISQHPRGVTRLRVTLGAIYPYIIGERGTAIEAVSGKRVLVLRRHDARCVEVSAYWKHWPCVIPQHGRGPKHLRRILLTKWQRDIAMADPRPFLRGLIHSDGCRIIATERKGRYVRRAPRYGFKNRSEDILGLFVEAGGVVGVHVTRPSPTQIAVYRKDSVARLDDFIGPKH